MQDDDLDTDDESLEIGINKSRSDFMKEYKYRINPLTDSITNFDNIHNIEKIL